MNGSPAPAGLWQEARAGDGRVYYYNTITKATQWTKPEDLMTSQERALTAQPWKEYQTPEGRKYWYNTQSKQSVWEMPEAYKAALQQDVPPPRPAAPTFVAGGTSNFLTPYRERDDVQMHDRQGGNDRHGGGGYQHHQNEGYRGPLFVPQGEVDYSSPQEAEAAFKKLLRKVGAQPEWSWEEVLRATVKDPQYRAIKDPKDRKVAFEDYILELKVQEKEKEKDRQVKLRNDFTAMLRSHPEIDYYTRWKTARAIVEGETIFKNARTEDERVDLYDAYRVELYARHKEAEKEDRKAAIDQLDDILGSLHLEPYTRWADAQGRIQADARFKSDTKFKILGKMDVIKAFENHIKSLERKFNAQRQEGKSMKQRRERRNRDQFSELLKDLKRGQKVRAGTKWKDVFPLIEDDPRYVAMLGQQGSTPLDMFWDVVEEEEQELRLKRNKVYDVLYAKRFEVDAKTLFDEFMEVMKTDRHVSDVDEHSMTLIFERLREKVLRRKAEDKDRAERHSRKAVEALRSRIKHLEPPVLLEDTWEKVRPRLEKFDEYVALDTDELRQSAFDKYQRRLREREEDVERQRERDRRRNRDYATRDRERDARDGHRRRTRTRSPEPDAYEADRRKAQADRERSHRRPSWQADRDGDDYRKFDRGSGRLSNGHYDSERKQREAERERLYISRADPRHREVDLDYGDGRPNGSKRRDPDDEGDRRDSKRLRRDQPRTKTPEQVEEEALKSGSEEGEIEES